MAQEGSRAQVPQALYGRPRSTVFIPGADLLLQRAPGFLAAAVGPRGMGLEVFRPTLKRLCLF